MNNQDQSASPETDRPRDTQGYSYLSTGSALSFGVRVRHHDKPMTDALYYWWGCGLSVEGKHARKTAKRFRTIKAAQRAANHIRRWLSMHEIETQICALPSWRVVKRSLPNTQDQQPARERATK